MKNRYTGGLLLPGLLLGSVLSTLAQSGPVLGPLPVHPGIREIKLIGPMFFDSVLHEPDQVMLVNMIPALQSGETENSLGADVAVNPASPADMVGGAYPLPPDVWTGGPPPLSPPVFPKPLFVSRDGGYSWAHNSILQIPEPNPNYHEEYFESLTLEFAEKGGYLYAGIHEGNISGAPWDAAYVMRSSNPFGSSLMVPLTNRYIGWYRPHLSVLTVPAGPSAKDRLFAMHSNYFLSPWWEEHGRTTSLAYSADARGAVHPPGLSIRIVQPARKSHYVGGKEPRVAAHPGGTIYGLYYGLHNSGSDVNGHTLADVVVIRDDGFGEGPSPFAALTDPSDGLSGRLVVRDRRVRTRSYYGPQHFGPYQESDLDLAVHPGNARMAYVVWADSDAVSRHTLHVRRTTDAGGDWGAELLSVPNAINPALAITPGGVVGLLYQQAIIAAGDTTWRTVLRRSRATNPMRWSELILCEAPNRLSPPTYRPRRVWSYDLEAVGNSFYGVFCEVNVPDPAHFPYGVRYQRNADFPSRRLLAADGVTGVAASMDPFFFQVTQGAAIPIQCALPPPYNPCSAGPFFDLGRILFEVDKLPFSAVDTLSRNCLVKFPCPGCEGTRLCPPYHHIHLEGLDPKQWHIGLYDEAGQPVRRRLTPIPGGVIVTFKPEKTRFRQKDIGDYRLAWASRGEVEKRKYDIKVRLEVSDFPNPRP